MTKRLTPTVRKDAILSAALALAERDGYQNITREGIAERAQCSCGLVSRYFSTMTKLKRAVMGAAVAQGNLKVIAQGLAARDSRALNAPANMKEAAAASLAG